MFCGDRRRINVTPNPFFVGTPDRGLRGRELSDSRLRLTPSGEYFSNLYDDPFSEWNGSQCGAVRRCGDASSKYVPRPAHAATPPFKVESTCFHLSRCPLSLLLLLLLFPPSSFFPLSLFSRFYSWLSLKEPRGEARPDRRARQSRAEGNARG